MYFLQSVICLLYPLESCVTEVTWVVVMQDLFCLLYDSDSVSDVAAAVVVSSEASSGMKNWGDQARRCTDAGIDAGTMQHIPIMTP